MIPHLSLPRSHSWTIALAVLASAACSSRAQETPPSGEDSDESFLKAIEPLGWQREGKGAIDQWAEIDIPPGYRFTGPKGATRLLTMTGNVPGDNECGIIAAEDFRWWAVFRFNEAGYVKDDEKDQIDAGKLLRQMKDSDEAENEQRKSLGLDELHVDGWAREPFFNDESKNLEWAIYLRDGSGNRSVNYNSKILGRRGFMDAVLVCGPDELEAVLPEFHRVIAGYRYNEGETYAEYKSGDKLAKVGLTALIVGGGAAVAAKTGLLAGLFKVIAKGGKAVWLIIMGVAMAVWNGFRRFFGKAG